LNGRGAFPQPSFLYAESLFDGTSPTIEAAASSGGEQIAASVTMVGSFEMAVGSVLGIELMDGSG
jgi:hypothetical protein